MGPIGWGDKALRLLVKGYLDCVTGLFTGKVLISV